MSSGNSNYNHLLSEYRKLAKRADARMLALERLSQQENYKNVKSWAYKKAAYNASYWGADPDKPRFNIKPPSTSRQLAAKIHDIQEFLDKPTSSKSGIEKMYQQRADKLNEHYKDYGINLDWTDLADFFESDLYKKISAKFGSDTAVKSIGILNKNKKEVLKDFKKKQASHLQTEDNGMIVNEAVKRMTHYYKNDVKKLLKLL